MKKAKTRNIVIDAIAVAVILILLLFLRSCGSEKQNAEENPSYEISDAISDSGPEQRSQSEIIDELNRLTEESQLTMTINPDPIFADGTARGNLLIHNNDSNRHGEIVEIVRDDTQETVYFSGYIPIGKHINSDALDVVLPAGKYPCTAYFHLFNEENGEVLGTGAVRVTLHIEN